jgi:hypothetical protein
MFTKLLTAILAAGLVIGALATEIKVVPAKPAPAAPANKGPKRYPYHANVAAVDLSAKTITLEGKKKQRVLYITPNTRVLKDKKPVALETIKIGEYVTGSLVDTDGHLEPTTVNVGGTKPKQPTPPAAQAAITPAPTGSIKVTKPNSSSSTRQ